MKFGTPTWVIICCTVLLPLRSLATAAPVEVVPATLDAAQQPQVAIDENGQIFVVFGRGKEINVAISADAGAHFRAPIKIGAFPVLALGLRRGPRIAVSGQSVIVTAMNHEDLYAFHSEDAGRSWSAPVKINRVATSAREGLGDLAAGAGGKFYATWLDVRSGATQIYGALSRDGGKTWDADELVYRSPDGHVCECCQPSATFNARGDLEVMWRNWLGGARDMWVAVRPADRDHFEPAVRQGTGTWKIDACPMDGGANFAQDDDSFASVWQRDNGVYLSLAPANERRLGNGVQPLALSAHGVVHVWWQQGANLMHTTSNSSDAPHLFAKNARFASAAVSPKDGTVVVAFERTIGRRKTIFAEVLR